MAGKNGGDIMAGKISELGAAGALVSSDTMEIVQSGVNKKIVLSSLFGGGTSRNVPRYGTTGLLVDSGVEIPQIKLITADDLFATTTLADVTDWTVSLAAGRKYMGRITIYGSNGINGDGIKINLGTSGSATYNASSWVSVVAASPYATLTSGTNNTLGGTIACTVYSGGNLVIGFYVSTNAAGTLIPQIAKNSNASGQNLTIFEGSSLELFSMDN